MKSGLAKHLENYKIILASGSPRRHELLKGLDIPFEIKTKEVDEVYPDHLEKQEITEYLAVLKAEAFKDLNSNELVITADTMVWLHGKPVMKPKDREHALKMLASMSGNKHTVYTSVCVRTLEKEVVFTDKTHVYFDKLSEGEIVYYVDQYKPFDKAGSYGAQDWIGYVVIKKMKGSFLQRHGVASTQIV
jgi:septum formation protein